MRRAIGPPSKSDRERFDKIVSVGCIACRLNRHYREPCEIHHLNIGGRHGSPNLGHDHTIGLCAWHHRGVTCAWKDAGAYEFERGPSFARSPNAFRDVIRRQLGGEDCDALLLEYQNKLIGERND